MMVDLIPHLARIFLGFILGTMVQLFLRVRESDRLVEMVSKFEESKERRPTGTDGKTP